MAQLAPPAPANPTVGRLHRLKLTEPVLLYAGAPFALLVLVLIAQAAGTGEWGWLVLGVLPFLLLTGGGILAARASSHSQLFLYQAVLRASSNTANGDHPR